MGKNNETTTRFNADISELKSAMQDAKKSIALANSEFKAASSSLDNWGKSTDGISAKLKQLDTTMNAQKTILSNLEQQYALVAKEQGEDSKAAKDLLISINNQKAAINATQKQIDKWNTSLSELKAESNQVETATQTLTNTINKQETELSQLKAKYTDVVLAQGKNSTEAKQLATQISNLSGELNDNKTKLTNASKAADDLDQSLDNATDSANDAEGGFTVLKGTIANLAAQAITKAVDALKDFISQANEVKQAVNGLQSSTGATSKEMKQYESVMKEIYNGNYGESYDDVAQSMSQVLQTMGKLNKTDLKNITTNGIALRDTFGFEMPESMRAVNSLMKQFGITADQAYNLIAQGAQNGLNQNDDLLDTINEYSVQFKGAGFSADQMFNMLKNGAASGTWSVDKLGDAVKEMNIRFSDGTVAEALTKNSKALGLSKKEVQNLQAEYNKGGTSAQNAVGKMVDAILNVKDETKQYQLGVAVFGTMWEDLGGKTIKSLMTTKGGIDKTKKSMDDIKNTKYDDVGNSLSQLGRMFKDQIVTPIKDNVNPAINDFVQKIITNFPQIKQAFIDGINKLKEWVPTLTVIGTAIATYLVATKIIAFVEAIKNGTLALKLMSAAQTALNAVMSLNPIGLIVAAIAALVVAFVLLWKKSETFREFWIGLWDGIKSACGTAIDAIGKFFTETLPNFFTSVIDWIKVNWSTILLFLINPFAGLFKYFYQNNTKFKEFVDTAIKFIKELPSKVWTWLLNTINKVGTWLKNMIAKAKETGTNFVTNVVNFIKELPSKIWTWLVNVVTKVTNWGSNMASKATNVATNFVNNVVNFIKNLPSKIWTWLVNVVTKVGTWGVNLASKGKEAAKKLFNSIVDKVKEIPSKMLSIGSDIVKGLWNGINNMTSWIADKIKGFGSSVTEGLKDFFGIKSPSRLMADEVGKYLPEGIALGIDKNAKSTLNSMKNLVAKTVGVTKSELDKNELTSGITGVTGKTIIKNYNQTINSPKPLSRLEIYRQSRNLFNFAGGVS